MNVKIKPHTKFLIEHPQIPVRPLNDRLGHDLLHFLRQHAHIDLAAAVVAEAIEPQAVFKPTKKHDVVLEPDVGAPSATATATAAAACAHSATAATMRHVRAATAAHTRGARTRRARTMGDVLATATRTPAAGTMRYVLAALTAADTLTSIAGATMRNVLATVRVFWPRFAAPLR